MGCRSLLTRHLEPPGLTGGSPLRVFHLGPICRKPRKIGHLRLGCPSKPLLSAPGSLGLGRVAKGVIQFPQNFLAHSSRKWILDICGMWHVACGMWHVACGIGTCFLTTQSRRMSMRVLTSFFLLLLAAGGFLSTRIGAVGPTVTTKLRSGCNMSAHKDKGSTNWTFACSGGCDQQLDLCNFKEDCDAKGPYYYCVCTSESEDPCCHLIERHHKPGKRSPCSACSTMGSCTLIKSGPPGGPNDADVACL